MRAVVRRLKAIISNAVLGGEETNVSAALPAADSVVDVKAALRETEQELLRHQISAKWDSCTVWASQTPERQLTCVLCGTLNRQRHSQRSSRRILKGARFRHHARSVT